MAIIVIALDEVDIHWLRNILGRSTSREVYEHLAQLATDLQRPGHALQRNANATAEVAWWVCDENEHVCACPVLSCLDLSCPALEPVHPRSSSSSPLPCLPSPPSIPLGRDVVHVWGRSRCAHCYMQTSKRTAAFQYVCTSTSDPKSRAWCYHLKEKITHWAGLVGCDRLANLPRREPSGVVCSSQKGSRYRFA